MRSVRRPVKNAEGRKRWSLSRLPGGCMVCGRRVAPDFRGFSCHHILGGNCGRSDEECNYLLVDGVCHDRCEGRRVRCPTTGEILTPISLGMALTIKALTDPAGWDIERLAQLNWSRLPPLEPIPADVEESWRRRNPARWNAKAAEFVRLMNEFIDEYEIER